MCDKREILLGAMTGTQTADGKQISIRNSLHYMADHAGMNDVGQ